MLSTIDYRGPNDSGELVTDDLLLGAVRLSIIDLKGGQQPLFGCDRNIAAVYNGEIYNYLGLRNDLRSRGHHLVDQCDATVLPHLYEEMGVSLVDELRGMFAFALWDAREHQLLLARDRLGIKPLYWASTRDFLVFGSEVKALFASGLVRPRIDPLSVDDLFSLSYPCPPRTMFSDVSELRPGHLLVTHAGEPLSAPRRYWRAPFRPASNRPKPRAKDLAMEFRDLMKNVVYDHLQADVKTGAYLSGGLDSASICGLVAEVTGDEPVTFSIGFDTPEHDELAFVRGSAGSLSAETHALVCDRSIAQQFQRMIWHTEMPLQFPLALPLMQLAGLARSRGFPVVLTGEGADELFGGYDCFRAYRMRQTLDRPGLRLLRPAFYKSLYRWLKIPDGAVDRMLEMHRAPAREVSERFGGVYPAWYDNWQIMDLHRDDLLGSCGREVRGTWQPPAGILDLVRDDIHDLDPLDAQLAFELETRLPAWILLIGDRASMAAGVEARVPFLDDRVVEFMASVPPALKMRGFREKELLRLSMKGLLPDQIRHRRKRPFYTPIAEWFFDSPSWDWVRDMLSATCLRDAGLFDPPTVTRMLKELQSVPRRHLRRHQLEWTLVQVLGLQVLHQQFVAGSPTAQPTALDHPIA